MRILVTIFIFLILFSCKERIKHTINPIPTVEIPKKSTIFSIDTAEVGSLQDSLLLMFYKANENKTFWLGDSIRKKIVLLLDDITSEGLFQKDFDLKEITTYEQNFDSLSDDTLVKYDILLTQNLNKYIQKVAKGTLDPKTLYADWELKENNINWQELLLNFQKKDSFDMAVQSIRPNHIVYKRLREALRIIDSFPEEKYIQLDIPDKIVLNDSIDVIKDIKEKLIYWKDLKLIDSLTPIYDDEMELAVKKFQMRHGLAPDGVIGKGTVLALNFSKNKRKEQIIANMERWRWYPRNFEEEYLIINIPDYSLYAIKNKDTTRNCKVIVGKLKRKTPVLSSKLSYLVLNPTWTVPPTILTEDVIPAVKKDKNYLQKKGIKVYDTNNQLIDSTNWKAEEAENYRYVQNIGRKNALGLVKFIFPNRFTIYIHDTNSRSYFARNNRALSSGCVRVQNPLDLAEYLLDDAVKWNLKNIEKTIKKGKTKSVGFHKDTYIHIFYWTAWSDNGSLQFRDDLYGLDRELYERLSN